MRTQLLPSLLTLDVASGFPHEGVLTFQLLLYQLEDAVGVFALSQTGSR